nr:hypothetical protein [Streptomyces hyaluromycini]
MILAVAQAVLGFHGEARWLRIAHAHLHGMFPYLPRRPAYNRRLRVALPLVKRAVRSPAADPDRWLDDAWIVDSPPVECARSREAVRRSDSAGRVGYGYCRSHSRFCRSLKPAALLDFEPGPATARPGLPILADKGCIAVGLNRFLAARSVSLLRPSHHNRGVPHSRQKPCSKRCDS